jgi:hypothetical protein
MGQRPYPDLSCAAPLPDRHRAVGSTPGLFMDRASYGGTASWTAEGDPPAGDRCPVPPPGVNPRTSP